MSEKRPGLEVCPRCKNEKGPVKGIEVYNGYVYVFHGYEKVDGKWRKIRCYLGPVSEYKHVTKLHKDFEGLAFLGLAEVELDLGEVKKASLRPRAVAYLKQLLKYVRENAQQLAEGEVEELVRELEAALAALKRRRAVAEVLVELTEEALARIEQGNLIAIAGCKTLDEYVRWVAKWWFMTEDVEKLAENLFAFRLDEGAAKLIEAAMKALGTESLEEYARDTSRVWLGEAGVYVL
jgi:hypothetical protein